MSSLNVVLPMLRGDKLLRRGWRCGVAEVEEREAAAKAVCRGSCSFGDEEDCQARSSDANDLLKLWNVQPLRKRQRVHISVWNTKGLLLKLRSVK